MSTITCKPMEEEKTPLAVHENPTAIDKNFEPINTELKDTVIGMVEQNISVYEDVNNTVITELQAPQPDKKTSTAKFGNYLTQN